MIEHRSTARVPCPELADWFACEADKSDAPELHLLGLRVGDLHRCFAAIVSLAPQWNDRTFHVDDEGIDAGVLAGACRERAVGSDSRAPAAKGGRQTRGEHER